MRYPQSNRYLLVKGKTLQIAATLALVILLCNSTLLLAGYYQARIQLSSPVIPKSIASQLSEQQFIPSIISLVGALVALALYLFRRYLLLIGIAAITLAILVFIKYG